MHIYRKHTQTSSRHDNVLATSTSSGGSGGPGLETPMPNTSRTNVLVSSPSRDTTQEIPVPTILRAAHPSTILTVTHPIAGGTHAMLVAAIDSNLDQLTERFAERFDNLEHCQAIADIH